MARNISKRSKTSQKPPVKEKFVVEGETFQQQAIPRFSPATVNQKLQLQYLKEGRSVVFSLGAAGVGKSLVAAYHAACLLKEKKIEKILLIRPVVYVGNTIGMLSGTADEKLSVWFKQTVTHLEKFLGVGFTRYCLDKGIIQYQALEHVRGMSFEDCYCIIEEAQGLTRQEFELILTRVGKGGQICLTADSKQAAKRDNSGLNEFMALLNRVIEEQPEYLSDDDLDVLENDIGIVNYTVEDIQRSGVVKAVYKMCYYNN